MTGEFWSNLDSEESCEGDPGPGYSPDRITRRDESRDKGSKGMGQGVTVPSRACPVGADP
jgi:hypothetical protein